MQDPAPVVLLTGPSAVGKTTLSVAVASSEERGVLLRIDDFSRFVVSGGVEPWLPEASQQNDVVGRAVVAAAMRFAVGGYLTVIDGYVFPESLPSLRRAFQEHAVSLHYAILRADLGVCRQRAIDRAMGHAPDDELLSRLHARFVDLGGDESNVIDARGSVGEVTADLFAAIRSGMLMRDGA